MSSDRIILVALYYVGAATPLLYATQDFEAHDPVAFGGALDDQYIEGRVEQPGLIERTMHGPGKLRGAAPPAAGALVLANGDGELDSILTESFDGQQYTIYEMTAAGTLGYILRRGTLEQPTYDDGTITFQCRDTLHALDVQLLTAKYAGTNALPNGIEGTPDDIAGLPKPVLLGTCLNVTPVQVNTSKKIYQFDGVRGFRPGYSLALYDKRAVVTEDGAGDYTDQTDMETNNPTAGQYRVWPAGGCVRINFTPVGQLTGDVTNPADFSTGGVAAIKDVLRTLNADVLDARSPDASLGFIQTGQIYDADPDVGIYIQDTRTALTAVQELLASVGGYIVTGFPVDGSYAAGILNAAQLYEPDSPFYTPHLDPIEITEAEIVEGTYPALVPPAEPDRGLPVWRVNVQYAKNWTVMTASDLAGVAAAEVAKWTQEYRTASVEDAAIKTAWPAALELTVTTLIADEADAQAEAQRLLDLFGIARQRLTIRIPSAVVRDDPQMGSLGRAPVSFMPGARVTLQLARFGLDAGKTFVVLEMREDFAAEIIDLVIWG